MIKAVLIDYAGTIVQEGGSEMQELVMRICHNSVLREPQELIKKWWGMLKQYEEESYKESYIAEDEIVDKLLHILITQYGLKEDMAELHRLIQGYWVNAPIFSDVQEFFEKCPLPIYIISNNDTQYVEQAMKINGISPTCIICANMVKAYKPHPELFQKALQISGCKPDEVIHIGDSYQSDVKGAYSVGIRPILIDRKNVCNYKDITTIQNLCEALSFL